ncbi:MAG: DNA polymerase III subunit gamma/tau [Oscillospiraceae bacterium]|jgi:DNA polymerase-3 subunit gamma/tau|nr:DNA polymerase III subunit gamma/tau [Oscillospiraceae bacterium]
MYRVLYRQYRPQTFAEVAGQRHVTSALSAELTGSRLAHAYLFTGSRGTGKTTCAKILSRAVNCENPAPNGDPCNECEICRGILEGTVLDVAEIDAASNNSVDNIRELKEEADFPPVRAKYRVYIIDEVHMLSIGAFNALLKVLEEPPEHVIFILATTEVHKIPATILSRCQRFDFRRILPEEIATRLAEVARSEGVSLTPEAALLIARIADGALRDALSLLDGAISVSPEVTEAVVSRAAGVADRSYLFQLADIVAANDTAAALRLLHTLYSGACDMERLCSELLFHFRNLMLTGTLPNARDLVVCTDAEYDEIKRQGALFNLPEAIRAIRVLERALGSMKFDSGKRLLMELALVKLCSADEEATPASKRIAPAATSNPPAPATGNITAPIASAVPIEAPPQPKNTPTAPISDEPNEPNEIAPQPQTVKAPTVPDTFWDSTLRIIAEKNPALSPLLRDSAAEINGGQCVIHSAHPALPMLAQTAINAASLESALESVCGKAIKFVISADAQAAPNPKADDDADPLDGLEESLFG